MMCNKMKKRNLLNMFEILTCSNCFNDHEYEFIYIGNDIINIYKLNNECINNIKKQKMIEMFMKESILNVNDIFLILNEREYIYNFDYFPLLLDNINLYILIL